MNRYFDKVHEVLREIEEHEGTSLKKAADLVVNSIHNGGILQLFGSGHSQLLAQDAFYRAGGLVPVKPISIEPLMLHKGAVESSNNEKDISKMPEYWAEIDLQPHDVLVVISTSGRNAVPVEIAKRATEMGVPVITLQSLKYEQQPSRHPSGKRLEDFATVVLNNHVPVGDGVIQVKDALCGPVSTVTGATLLNELSTQVIQLLSAQQDQIPVFMSNNIESEQNTNEYFMNQYKERINFN